MLLNTVIFPDLFLRQKKKRCPSIKQKLLYAVTAEPVFVLWSSRKFSWNTGQCCPPRKTALWHEEWVPWLDVFRWVEDCDIMTLWHITDAWGWQKALGTSVNKKGGHLLNRLHFSQHVSPKDYTPSKVWTWTNNVMYSMALCAFFSFQGQFSPINSLIYVTSHLLAFWGLSTSISVPPGNLRLPSRKLYCFSLRTK